MHPSAMANGQSFFDAYSAAFKPDARVVEIGSQDVNGSLRQCCPKTFQYVGLDFEKAKGVDIVLQDPYALPIESESADIVVSNSCFEHSEMFWLVFLEILRILKPGGLFYLNAPSTGNFHRYPVDCWRFFPDSGKALVTWGKRSGFNVEMLESYTQKGGLWEDFVCVFLKDAAHAHLHTKRILDVKTDFENGQKLGSSVVLKRNDVSQNEKKLAVISKIASGTLQIN